MEILKKSTLLLLMLAAGFVYGQNWLGLQNAFAKSYTLEQAGNWDGAITEIKAVYAENSYECNLRLGWLYYSATKYAESISYYTKATKLNPKSAEALWGLVNPLVATEKWTDLEVVYKEILKLDPNNSQAHYYLGTIYYYRKDYTNAKSHFDISLGLYPFDYSSMLMSGWTYYFLGKTEEAKTLFQRVLMNNPKDKSALDGLKLIN
jgi:tetratricopeptide (TPR) repeat protein